MPQRTSRTAQSDPDLLPAGTGEVAYGHPTQLKGTSNNDDFFVGSIAGAAGR